MNPIVRRPSRQILSPASVGQNLSSTRLLRIEPSERYGRTRPGHGGRPPRTLRTALHTAQSRTERSSCSPGDGGGPRWTVAVPVASSRNRVPRRALSPQRPTLRTTGRVSRRESAHGKAGNSVTGTLSETRRRTGRNVRWTRASSTPNPPFRSTSRTDPDRARADPRHSGDSAEAHGVSRGRKRVHLM